jgi:hypothetical protein
MEVLGGEQKIFEGGGSVEVEERGNPLSERIKNALQETRRYVMS